MKVTGTAATRFVEDRLLERNRVSRSFFPAESERLARVCQQMADRFLAGGRLLAFGRQQYATDAQHVSVEFVHPVIVGKRALPALDLSAAFSTWLPALARAEDMVMGFGSPLGDPEAIAALECVRPTGAQLFVLSGPAQSGRYRATGREPAHDYTFDYALVPPTSDPFIHQELVEVLYHTLWETVHVFFEHRERGHDVGEAAFLYPFLGRERQDTSSVVNDVAASIRAKASEDERLREQVARRASEAIVSTTRAINERVSSGGTLILFGNGGSATDANDWALDCVCPLKAFRPVPAVSLSMEPANLSAIANDIGHEAIFLRQLIAQARPGDVAIAISTSGGSANVIAALVEARKRGLLTVALLGYDGGEIVRQRLADFPLVIECDYIPRIQEAQASIYHVMLELMESGQQ